MNSRLWTETLGSGPDLVLLHGWGLHSVVWEDIARELADDFRVTLIDLPGHGRSPWTPHPCSLGNWAEQIAAVAPPTATYIGWSLGGMAALQLALDQPERVTRLVLVASTPRFVQAPSWPDAVRPEVLASFAQELEHDYRATVRRFLALQTRGGEQAGAQLRQLNARLFTHGEPHLQALHGGLTLLAETDLRRQLARIACPILLVLGEQDTLVPVASGEKTVAMFQHGQLEVMAGTAHAPFLTHPRRFLELTRDFLVAKVQRSTSEDRATHG